MTQKQYDEAEAGSHVRLICANHPDLQWSCKKLSTGPDKDGVIRYNGMRNIFFFSLYPKVECDCPASDLYVPIE